MSFIVTHKAPSFEAAAVLADGEIVENFASSSLRGRYAILLFYPFDFSFVCPTEILAFDSRLEEFSSRDCSVVGISVDSTYTHIAWRRTAVEDGGIGPIRFPLLSDTSREISRSYGVLFDDSAALRGLFLLDREGVVRHALVNDQPLGRSVEETLRVLDALRFHDAHGELCPAEWQRGQGGVGPAKKVEIVDRLSKYTR